ncbi:uncharacterized protein [Apostichopus japonicus]|uniref:uncharacterized protein isoform X1 n=1 Tax=Stichopus japonicus TaxID=307972 RepID=UPI003AB8D4AD
MASKLEAASTSDIAKIIPDEKDNTMDAKTVKFIVFFVAVANVIALVALIVAFVGASKSNEFYIDTAGSVDSDVLGETGVDRVWVFQIGHYVGNTQYLDEDTETIKGYNVDVVNAVCQIANKNCRLTWDLYERCWDSQAGERPRGGIGLMGGWYDACVGWAITRDRARTYSFSTPFEKTFEPTYWVKPGGSFTSPNFNNLKVAILDGWSVDEHCLARYDDVTDFDESDASQVIHFRSEDDVIAALKADMVDVAFLPKIPYLDSHLEIELAAYQPDTDRCVLGGPAMMMPKDQDELTTWFNAAFNTLKSSYQYQDICDNLKDEHGDQPGNDPEYICVD